MSDRFIKILMYGIIIFTTAAIPASAKNHFTLYGLKIGQHILIANALLGKPSSTETDDAGYITRFYQLNNLLVVIESRPNATNQVWSIQITGTQNPENKGFAGINLGDSKEKMISLFGQPDKEEKVTDPAMFDRWPDLMYYSYYDKYNFSFQISQNKVVSIKTIMTPDKSVEDLPDINKIIAAAKYKDYYALGEILEYDMYISRDAEYYKVEKSVYEMLSGNTFYNELFFNAPFSISKLESKDIKKKVMRPFTDSEYSKGYVFLIEKNKIQYELVFVKSFEGWVLWEVNFLEHKDTAKPESETESDLI